MPDEVDNQVAGAVPRVLVSPPKPLELENNMKEAWKRFISAYEWYAKAAQVDNQPAIVRAAIFMSVIGPNVQDIFESFGLSEAERGDVSVIKARFQEYFIPKANDLYEGFVLRQIMQGEEEKFHEFLTKVTVQAKRGNYQSLTDRMILEQIVIGIRWEKMKEKILSTPNVTLKQAIDFCLAYELALSQKEAMANTEKPSAKVDALQKDSQTQKSSKEYDCQRCGRKHEFRKCPAFNKECRKCGEKGHFANRCKKLKVQEVKTEGSDKEDELETFKVCEITTREKKGAWIRTVQCNGKPLAVKIDTGADCCVINSKMLRLVNVDTIQPSGVQRLIAYNGSEIPVMGQVVLQCKFGDKVVPLTFQVIKSQCTTIIDGEAAIQAGLIKRLNEVKVPDDVFEGLGCVKDFIYEIDLVDDPKFTVHPARVIPYPVREDVKKELQKMEKMDVIKKCSKATDSVSPLVVVRRNGKIRICIDLTDVNKNIKRRHFPLSTIEEISTRLSGSTRFTILDCTRGFWQVQIAEKSQDLLTFATPWGRYSCKRLPFGLASAPEVFQKLMCQLFEGVEGVEVSMDDILIHASDEAALAEKTATVLKIIQDSGLKLNREKCVFDQPEVKFLGHLVSKDGLKADPEKVEAIKQLKPPGDVKALQRLLGMLNYLSKFIENLSNLTEPLRMLTKNDVEYIWGPEQRDAFELIKKRLIESPVLKLYDVSDNVLLSVDASSYGLGAVLMQSGQPVAYAAKALTDEQKQWPQIAKEAIAIRFALRKFHDYIWGKHIVVETDHKPLEAIYKKTLSMAPPRLKRILYDVKSYAPHIIYRKGTEIPIADTLSRDCNADTGNDSFEDRLEVNVILALTEPAEKRFVEATREDRELQLLKKVIDKGWPDDSKHVPAEIRHYFAFREELDHVGGLIFKGDRCVVPEKERRQVLQQIHYGHAGLNTCLRRIKEYFYWPGVTKEMTDIIESCQVCQANQRFHTKETLMMKQVPELPFEIVSTDLFSFQGNDYVLVVDSYSGYYDFVRLKNTSSESVIAYLKEKFSEHGVPRELHSDGGPQYSSREFKEFAKSWGFDHKISSPYFPRSNGLAERYVQSAKNLLKKCTMAKQDVRMALLLDRNSPKETLRSPAERLFGRKTRNPLVVNSNSLKPALVKDNADQLQGCRDRQKMYADRGAKEYPQMPVGATVRLRDQDGRWLAGQITDNATDRSYMVKLEDGRVVRRNGKFIAPTKAHGSLLQQRPTEMLDDEVLDEIEDPPSETENIESSGLPGGEGSGNRPSVPHTPGGVRTRSGRLVVPPQRLNL